MNDKSQTTELINVSGEYQGTSNIRRLRLIYSLKSRKFVRGFLCGSRVAGDVRYRLFPGKYVEFSFYNWTKDDPPHTMNLILKDFSLVDEKVRETIIKQVMLRFATDEFLDALNIPQVSDFFRSRPSYHSRPDKQIFDKVYTDNDRLLQFLDRNSGKTIWEGEEHE